MSKLEGVEIGFERMTEEDGCWRDEICQEVRLDVGEGKCRFLELLSRDTGPPEMLSVTIHRGV
jgi:hypothetical protein